MTITPGTQLGPYQVVRAIGAGGMGEVYEALDGRLGRTVAIKVIAPDVAHDAGRVGRFEREARLCSALNHPNIVTIHEFAQAEGVAYIVMELVDGQSLRALLSAGRVPTKKLFSIAAQIAEGMAAAHAVGVIHRDLKPENLMVTRDEKAKILDFGLARAEASADVTKELVLAGSHKVMGTAAYMSPEQAVGAAVDFRADQFAFGTILYELATGKNPFRRPTTLAVLEAIEADEPASLADVQPPFPELFAWIVQRCLSKDPSGRYASTHDLARDLGQLRDSSHRGATGGMKRRKPARNVAWIVALAFALMTAALAAALFLRPQPAAVAARAYVTLHMPEILTVTNEAQTPFALTPDGQRLVVAGYGAGTMMGLFIRDLKSTVTVAIPGTENGYAPMLSPDGRQLAFFADGKLKIVPLEGGPPRIVTEAGESTMSWGRDGTILLARNGEWGTAIFAVKAAGGTAVPVMPWTKGQERVFQRWPEMLPDGKRFLYLAVAPQKGSEASGRRHILMAGSLDGSSPTQVGPIDSRVSFHDGRLLHVRNGTLLAQRFDVETMSLHDDPVSIVDGVYNYTSSGVAAFAVARNGTVVYRRPRAGSRVMWFDRGGLQGNTLAHIVLGRQSGDLSRDGHRYATGVVDPKVGSADVWIYDLVRNRSVRATYGDADDTHPVWSADGRSLYFRSDAADGGGPPDVYRQELGTSDKQLVFQGDHLEEPSDVSPDGRHLLVERWNERGGTDIVRVSLEDGKASDFMNTPFTESNARFSPDGKWVAFDSTLSGTAEVYLVKFPEGGPPDRISAGGGTRPRWRGDGRELFYLSGSEVTAVDLRTRGTSIEAGQPRPLFRAAAGIVDFEALPDGQRFLVRTPEDSVPEVYLVLNALPPSAR